MKKLFFIIPCVVSLVLSSCASPGPSVYDSNFATIPTPQITATPQGISGGYAQPVQSGYAQPVQSYVNTMPAYYGPTQRGQMVSNQFVSGPQVYQNNGVSYQSTGMQPVPIIGPNGQSSR